MISLKYTLLAFILLITTVTSWQGILMDGSLGNTQLYIPNIPNMPPISVPNVNFSLPHLSGFVGVMFQNRAYFIGGQKAGSVNYTNLVTIFDPLTNTTTQGPQLNYERGFHSATVVGDTIIVCGGQNTTKPPTCEQYNPSTQMWTQIASLPIVDTYFSMVTLNGYAYIIGGSNQSDQCFRRSSIFQYDGTVWNTKLTIDNSLREHASVEIDADRVLICGGTVLQGRSCIPTQNCSIYTASFNQISGTLPMKLARSKHAMVVFNGWSL
jgi:hypothetical protein